MSVKVKTGLWSNFNIPSVCVACGDPPAAGATNDVTCTEGKTTLRLAFPLCQPCREASRQRFIGWVPLGVVSLMAIWPGIGALALLLTGVFSMDVQALVLGLVLGGFTVGVLAGGILLKVRIDTWGMTPEQRQRRETVARSVTISTFREPGLFKKAGAIIFEFANDPYGTRFANLNAGELV